MVLLDSSSVTTLKLPKIACHRSLLHRKSVLNEIELAVPHSVKNPADVNSFLQPLSRVARSLVTLIIRLKRRLICRQLDLLLPLKIPPREHLNLSCYAVVHHRHILLEHLFGDQGDLLKCKQHLVTHRHGDIKLLQRPLRVHKRRHAAEERSQHDKKRRLLIFPDIVRNIGETDSVRVVHRLFLVRSPDVKNARQPLIRMNASKSRPFGQVE